MYEWGWKAPQDLGLAVYLGVNTWGLRGVVCMAMDADIDHLSRLNLQASTWMT